MNTTRLNPALVARKTHHALEIHRQHDVEPDDRAPAEGVGRDRVAHDRVGQDGDRNERLGRGGKAETKKAPIASAKANSARTGNEVQAKRTPPMLSASMNDTLATTISMAPAISSRCGRS